LRRLAAEPPLLSIWVLILILLRANLLAVLIVVTAPVAIIPVTAVIGSRYGGSADDSGPIPPTRTITAAAVTGISRNWTARPTCYRTAGATGDGPTCYRM